ncbi:WXG100 family type VII secretion target [Streptomyces albidoflavus]|uniref:WXG100 family type VII secretion target n=1 Tax=Streptomyces TaxID=1883 RepID=UPI001BEAA86F|nr:MULTISPECIES: WXG100 family type VII secretion target [unclassified Streptomyces]MBT2886624.1 WXG100 family type VII secretion target [Streptomyces sp. McG5]MBT2893047.1 WXG100 family type VII secretion target [Streptomyces sp. McG2]WSB16387.1 WXG100 family type VII secretion target [Streptomyces albidoflavus]
MPGRRPAFPHIGWDPTPGDVADTRDLAKTLGGLATDLGEAVRDLDRIDAGAWKGKAANAFVEYVGEDVTPLIRKSHQSFGKASRALHRWSRELQDFQDEADRLEVRAGEKLAAKEKAEKAAEGKGSKELGEVDEITRKVRDLQDRYNRAAAEITKELDKAGDIAPDEPGFWGKLTQGVKDAWDATTDWVKEHADLIALIGDLLSDLTALLGFLAIATLPFPPLAAIFGTAALVTTGLALAAHSIAKAGGADVSWAKIGLDAVGLLPGIGMFGKGIKVVGKPAATSLAGKLGKGFSPTKIGSARVLKAFGKGSKGLTGGIGKEGIVKIGGKSTKVYEVAHAGSGLRSRMGGLAEAGYHHGQWFGSRSLNLIPGVNINPAGAGIAIDGGLKLLPKVTAVPQHVGEAASLGDETERATK